HSTSSALLEQLVYIDNFMSTNGSNAGDLTPNLDIDGQLSIDLAAFADDSFIFPDEDKPKNRDNDNDDANKDTRIKDDPEKKRSLLGENQSTIDSSFLESSHENTPGTFPLLQSQNLNGLNVSKLPKFPVPPGAKSSLVSAGLSQNQIDLLSALIAQHQTSLGNSIPPSSTSPDLHRQQVPHLPSQGSSFNFNSPVPATTGHGSSGSISGSSNGFVSSELDKRRRNTAASARFRIKKKLKEKQMENQLLSLNDLIKDFEVKVQQLEMENKLLRNLIIEKGSQKSDQELKVLRERARM
ncbi:uncharacterized protein CANTADRAFT_31259, partial [Suhomyces tanzawaensis NRRL Y-17324]